MNHRSSRGFTLIEMLTVMAVIGVLAALVVAVSGLVQRNAAVKRAEGEIAALSAACENYKNDNGEYPNDPKTDQLDPRADGNPVTGESRDKYEDACVVLYSALSGDAEPDKHPDYRPEEGKKIYFEFKKDQLNYKKTGDGSGVQEVNSIQDPWGNSYGYSTARNKAEREFMKQLRKDANATRPTTMPGYNPTFDLWSTGGSSRDRDLNGEQEDVKKWVKNW